MFKKISNDLYVSEQLDENHIRLAVEAGFRSFICNRPDGETDDQPSSDALQEIAESLGANYVLIPVSGGHFSSEAIAAYKAAVEIAAKPCLAFCRSGTRSTVLWALGQVGTLDADEILETASAAGYDLSHMSERFELKS